MFPGDEAQRHLTHAVRMFLCNRQTMLQLSGTDARQRNRQEWKLVPGPLVLESIEQSSGDAVGGVCIAERHFAFSLSPRSGREGFTPCSPGCDDALFHSDGLVEHPESIPWVDVPVVSGGLLEGAGSFSSSAANEWDSAVVRAFGFRAVDAWLMSRLDMVKEDLENSTFFSFVDEEGATHSPVCLTGTLIGCMENEYRSPSRRQCNKYCHARLLGMQRCLRVLRLSV